MAKLICTIEMSKERGVTVTVTDADGKITQTVSMDGTTLTLKVAGDQETSSWAQTQDKITITCKDFELNASNSIKCTADQTIDFESKQGDTTIKSGAKLTEKATGDIAISSSANTNISATSAAKLKGMSVEISADTSLKLKGGVSAELAGPSVNLKADASLSAKSSGVASLEGSITNIKGSLIKAG